MHRVTHLTFTVGSPSTGVSVKKYANNRPVTAEQLHLRTDHVFTDRLRYIQRHGLVDGIKGVKLSLSSDCDACRLAKSFRKHVPVTSLRPPATRPLELVHMDTLTVDTKDYRGRRYALVIVGFKRTGYNIR